VYMKTLSYGETVSIKGLRRPYHLVLDQKGYRASRGLPFTDEMAQEELRRGGRSVGFIAIDDVQKPVDHTLFLGELVQVSGVVYTVSAPGVGDGESANLVLGLPVVKKRKQRKRKRLWESPTEAG
jgi:hypothetical protein